MEDLHSMRGELPPVIGINKDKCVNCHACISACPVKFCNDGSGDHVTLDSNTCIGCGTCLAACTHDARYYIDDFQAFLGDLSQGIEMVAIAAPSAAANFPGRYRQLNGWLKSLGVKAVFDVSFGAELAVKSYVEHVRANAPETTIAQPCPAIVTFVEIYHPELLPYLAPVDSPMGHCMKMIRRFYPEYGQCRIAVVSPCIAKKREFAATGLGDYNVGYVSIAKHLEDTRVSLDDFPAVDYDNPPPERAVLFSSPGGLRRSVARWLPDLAEETRKIEGAGTMFQYLGTLPKVIENHRAPRLVDCLSCEMGCNGGPLTLVRDVPLDQIEYWVEQRNKEMQAFYRGEGSAEDGRREIEEAIGRRWERDLYQRRYADRRSNNVLKHPTEAEREAIYRLMHKYSKSDIYNCTACGYMACQDMATAIFNGKNKPENCHWYLAKETGISHEDIVQREYRFRTILETSLEGFIQVDNELRIEMVNESLCKMLERPAGKLVGMSLYDLAVEGQAGTFAEQAKLRNQGLRSVYEIDLVRPDGSSVNTVFSASPLYNKEHRKIGSWALVSDITREKLTADALRQSRDELEERVQKRTYELEVSNVSLRSEIERRNVMEGALRESERKVQTILHGCPIPQFVIDRDHRVISWNRTLEEYSGIRAEEVLGTTDQWRAFYPERRPCLADLLMEGGMDLITRWYGDKYAPSKLVEGGCEAVDFFPHMIGGGRWLYFTAAVIRDAEGSVIGAIETLEDITERKQGETERDALIAELEAKNAELERFTYTVSHDLKSPLVTIQGFLGCLDQDVQAGDAELVKADTTRISNAAKRMQQLLDELLELSRIGRLKNPPQEVPLVDLAREAADVVGGQLTRRGVEVAIAPDLPVVHGDRPRLLEVLQNLLDNSSKFMGDQVQPRVDVGCRRDGAHAVFFVRDNGVGIEPRYHQKVFELFAKLDARTEGTGVGLAIVKRIVEVHGGRIWVESEGTGKGSTFCFTLRDEEPSSNREA